MNRPKHGLRLKIASLAPNATSILVAIGAKRQLVGVSRWCSEVADVRGLPKLGDCWRIDLKPLERLHPELVVGSVPFASDAVSQILLHPWKFLALNPRSLADIYSDIWLLGSLTQRQASAEKLIRRMKGTFEEISRHANNKRSRPRVYCEAWPSPRISSPPWVKELVKIAGGEFIEPAGAKVSDEEVARGKPDVIVLAWTATGKKAKPSSVLQNRKWQELPAIRNRRVFVISDELLNTPGPPLEKGAEALFRVLHEEN
ncbi:MAG: ABC transporter substrate-binding protein [Candidatus Acidiferrales bacterium]